MDGKTHMELGEELKKVAAELTARAKTLAELRKAAADVQKKIKELREGKSLMRGDSQSVILGEAFRRSLQEKEEKLQRDLKEAEAACGRAEERVKQIQKEMEG